jgi:hypothetical protein
MKDMISEDVKGLRENLETLLQAESRIAEAEIQRQQADEAQSPMKTALHGGRKRWAAVLYVAFYLILLACSGYATIVQYHQGYFDYARYCLAATLVILLILAQDTWLPYFGAHVDWLERQNRFVSGTVSLTEFVAAFIIILWFGVGTSILTRGW